MDLGLNGKVALVTGSSRGIGRGIALTLANEGCDLLLTGRDQALLDETAETIRGKGRRAVIVNIDLREEHAPAKLIEAVQREFGHLDVLVNNAGTTKRGDFFALTDADWEEGYALKFFAHVRLARAAWPLLKERRRALVAIGGNSGRPAAESVPLRRPGQGPRTACPSTDSALAEGGRRAGQLRTSEPGRDRAAMAAHPRRGRAHRGAGGENPRAVLSRDRHHTLRQGRGCRGLRDLHRLGAHDLAARRDGGPRRRG